MDLFFLPTALFDGLNFRWNYFSYSHRSVNLLWMILLLNLRNNMSRLRVLGSWKEDKTVGQFLKEGKWSDGVRCYRREYSSKLGCQVVATIDLLMFAVIQCCPLENQSVALGCCRRAAQFSLSKNMKQFSLKTETDCHFSLKACVPLKGLVLWV